MTDEKELDAISRRVDEGEAVTKDEAMALVCRIARTCKGPIKPGKEAEYAELRRQLGPVGMGTSIALVDSLNRDYCGADFNDVICSFPFDGEEHLKPCKKCGQMISFRSPVFKLKS